MSITEARQLPLGMDGEAFCHSIHQQQRSAAAHIALTLESGADFVPALFWQRADTCRNEQQSDHWQASRTKVDWLPLPVDHAAVNPRNFRAFVLRRPLSGSVPRGVVIR